MSDPKKFYSPKRIIDLSKRLFVLYGGRSSGKSQIAHKLMEEKLRKYGGAVVIIRRSHDRSMNVKASRKKLIKRGC